METLTSPAPDQIINTDLLPPPVPNVDTVALPIDTTPLDFNKLEEELSAAGLDQEMAAGTLEQPPTKWQNFKRTVFNRLLVEGAGVVLDTALIAAGGAGVAPFTSVAARESVGTTADYGLFKFLSRHNTHEDRAPVSRTRHIGQILLFGGVGMIAQKTGFDLAHIASAHSEAARVLMPVGVNVGAKSGLQSAINRIGR